MRGLGKGYQAKMVPAGLRNGVCTPLPHPARLG